MPIIFGNETSSYYFSDPVAISRWAVKPKVGGVYAILTPDPNCSPQPFRVIYFGKAVSFPSRLSQSHEHYLDWCKNCPTGQEIYLSLCEIASEADRVAVESLLIKAYQPVCNEKGVSVGSAPPLRF